MESFRNDEAPCPDFTGTTAPLTSLSLPAINLSTRPSLQNPLREFSNGDQHGYQAKCTYEFPLAAKTVKESFYVDDCAGSMLRVLVHSVVSDMEWMM
jgi:hypothetical protein